jgi:hypothetical protein
MVSHEICSSFRRLTRAPKVILVEEIEGRREPRVANGLRIIEGAPKQVLPLADYFVRRVLPTLDGDTREDFVNAGQESSLLSATASKKGALRFGLAAPVVAGARFERATFGL